MVYKKACTLNLKDADPAESVTLMSADIERIVQGLQTMHEIWANVAEIALAVFLLERELGIACVVPVGVSVGKPFDSSKSRLCIENSLMICRMQ
jgi:hypothetical protein